MAKEEHNEEFINPIDKDKVAERPGTLPYAHTVGGAVVKPEDKGKIKGRALAAMEEQTNMHLDQIQKQIELLAKQAKAILDRKEVSEKIYLSEMGFEPHVGQIYHLYERKNGQWVLSLVAPHEWGRSMPFAGYVSTVRMLSDHTWELL
ncbi:MAG: DUF2452 domain-containing protein [Bacteroidota bacterium]